eukprot:TRINITY_DN3714_c0_g1_i1.p1 TRINITY_DN3714_c0_g1~~TRINITY_DN3714_c0_g1_i1.p1  ORF type:complete len:775 (+),score=241.86 TRINITY_DN3714_c0_g1_i1:100-2325(+)
MQTSMESEGDENEQELKELQARQREQNVKEQLLKDAQGLLTQLGTVARMQELRAEAECFDSRVPPTGRIFMHGLPDPAAFAEHALGSPDTPAARSAELLTNEIAGVLQQACGSAAPPRVNLCFHRESGEFTGCAMVQLSVAEAGAVHEVFMEGGSTWVIPPQTQPVSLHHIEESDPVVLVRGGTGLTADIIFRGHMAHWGVVEEIIEPQVRTERRGKGITSPTGSQRERAGSIDGMSQSAERSPTGRGGGNAECISVRYATLEGALCCMANCHGRPVPGRDEWTLELEMDESCQHGVEEELRDMVQALGGDPDHLEITSKIRVPGRAGSYSVKCRFSGAAEVMRNLVCAGGGVQVVSCTPPTVLFMRLRRGRRLRAEDRQCLQELDDWLKLEKQQSIELHRDLHGIFLPQRDDKERALNKARGELAAMRTATGWDERKVFTSHTQDDRENRIRVLLRELAGLRVEQGLLAQEDEKAMTALEEVAYELHRRDEVLANHARLERELTAIREENVERARELKSLHRLLGHKSKRCDTLARRREEAVVRILEGDKRVRVNALERQKQHLAMKERTIAAQHLRLERLQEQILRLAAAAAIALSSQHETSVESVEEPLPEDGVPVEQYEEAQSRLMRARRALRSKERLLQEKDCTIEVLERHCDTVDWNVHSTARRHGAERKLLDGHVRLSQAFIRQQAREAERRKEHIRSGRGSPALGRLSRRPASSTPRSVPTAGPTPRRTGAGT